MDPATLAVVGLVGSAASAGIGAIGAINQANATAASQRYQAQVARNNQVIAQQDATQKAASGAQAARNQDIKTAQIIGAEEAGQGASGIDINSQSDADVRRSTSQVGRLDSLTTAYNADLAARSSQLQGTAFGNQAALNEAAASNALTAGGIGATTSILGGASSFADKWLNYQLKGVPGFGGLQLA